MIIHDSHIVSYEVNHEKRTILFCLKYDYPGEPKDYTDVIFHGVEGYQFYHDPFGTIVADFDEIPLQQLLDEQRNYLTEAYHKAGAPGRWAADLSTAKAYFENKGVKAFVLESSIGMSGWILARQMEKHETAA